MLHLAASDKKQLPIWPLSFLQKRDQHPMVLVQKDALWLLLKARLAQRQRPSVLRVVGSQLHTPTELYDEQKLRVTASLRSKI